MCISYGFFGALGVQARVTIRKTVRMVLLHLVFAVSTRSESLLIMNPASSFHPPATRFRICMYGDSDNNNTKSEQKNTPSPPHVMPEAEDS